MRNVSLENPRVVHQITRYNKHSSLLFTLLPLKKQKNSLTLTTTDRYSSEGHQHNITNENTESKQNMACHFNSSSTLVFCLQGVMSKIKLRVCHTGLGFWLSLKGMDNNDQRRYPKRFMMYGCEIPSLRLCFRLAVRLL